MTLALQAETEGWAEISEDGLFRYLLGRRWAPGGPLVCWIMLNPSTADAKTDDLTVKKCVGFSKAMGARALVVVNLFAFRATRPQDLLRAEDPVGPLNLARLREAPAAADLVVAAWGGVPKAAAAKAAASMEAVRSLTGLKCLGATKAGEPRHPSRLAYSTRLVPFGK